MKSKTYAAMPPEAKEALKTLGNYLKRARLRRNESQELTAQRISATRATIKRLESGHPGTTIGVLVNVLYVYGLLHGIEEVADPDKDVVGIALELNRLPKKARKIKNKEFNSDF